VAKRLFLMRALRGPSPEADYLLLGPIDDGMLALWWHEDGPEAPDHFSFVSPEALESDFQPVGMVEMQRWIVRGLLAMASELWESTIHPEKGEAVH